MRLICPNCGAQYEVTADMIPSAGRDVQCSSCAHTWFETPGASEAREAGLTVDTQTPVIATPPASTNVSPSDTSRIQAVTESTEPPSATWSASSQAKTRIIGMEEATKSDALAPPEQAPASSRSQAKTRIIGAALETTTDSLAKPSDAPDVPNDDIPSDATDTAPEAVPARQPLPTSVSDILREEAKREEAKRIEDTSGALDSQPDLGLDDAPLDRDAQLAEEARRRMARLKGEPAPAIGTATTTATDTRKDLLPDVEEINSSLRSETRSKEKTTSNTDKTARPKSGFRRGFMTIIILALLALLIYILAPRLSAMVPALEQPLDQYVTLVDQARLWLDLRIQGLLGDAET